MKGVSDVTCSSGQEKITYLTFISYVSSKHHLVEDTLLQLNQAEARSAEQSLGVATNGATAFG